MDAQTKLQGRSIFGRRQSPRGAQRIRLTGAVYLALAVVGAAATWTYNILWMQHVDRAITLHEFVLVGFQSSALIGSLASDFWVGSLASFIFMIVEGRRLRLPHLWICVVMTFVIAWACGLPFFLFLRERALATRNVMNCDAAEEVRRAA